MEMSAITALKDAHAHGHSVRHWWRKNRLGFEYQDEYHGLISGSLSTVRSIAWFINYFGLCGGWERSLGPVLSQEIEVELARMRGVRDVGQHTKSAALCR